MGSVKNPLFQLFGNEIRVTFFHGFKLTNAVMKFKSWRLVYKNVDLKNTIRLS